MFDSAGKEVFFEQVQKDVSDTVMLTCITWRVRTFVLDYKSQ